MKQVIKISLIAVVVIIIGVVLFLSINPIGEGPDEVIAPTSFEKHIQERTDNEVKGKDFASAQTAYEQIMQEINTEASITLGTGEKNLTDNEVIKSKKIVYYEYTPIFTQYGLSYFGRSSWDESMLNSLKNESSSLLNLAIAQSGTDVHKDLKKIIKNVDDYHTAWKVAKSAEHCSSVNDIANLKASADKYKQDPLTNNASLKAALNAVESNAKKSVIRVIVRHCNIVANNYSSYGNYVSWTLEYDNACKRINEYKNKYDYPSELKTVRQILDNADTDALRYYSGLEQTQ